MIAEKIVREKIKILIEELQKKVGVNYSMDCDQILEKIRILNNLLNSPQKLNDIEKYLKEIEKEKNHIGEIKSYLKNVDFFYKTKKGMVDYSFSLNRSIIIKKIREYEAFNQSMINNDQFMDIMKINSLYQSIEEKIGEYVYHKIMKNFFMNKIKYKKIVKELVIFRTLPMKDVIDDEEIIAFSNVVILKEDQMSAIKRCHYFKEDNTITKNSLLVNEEKIKELDEMVDSMMVGGSIVYSF